MLVKEYLIHHATLLDTKMLENTIKPSVLLALWLKKENFIPSPLCTMVQGLAERIATIIDC